MNITYRHYSLDYFLESMTQLGINHIELWAGEPHLYVYRNVLGNIRYIRRQLKARGMKLVCFTPEQCVYPYNIAASDAGWRQKSVDYFTENLYAAAELETEMMLLTSGIGDFATPLEEALDYASDSIYRIARVAEREGLTVVLEPLTKFESNLITDLNGIRRVMDQIQSPALKGMIDTVAMQLAGEGPGDYFDALPELGHVHLIDGDGVSDAHLGLDDGVLDWRSCLTALQNSQYDGAITLEIMGFRYYENPQEVLMKSIAALRESGFLS
ncbi:TIM barrel protein [Paenibacillus methanolicus]